MKFFIFIALLTFSSIYSEQIESGFSKSSPINDPEISEFVSAAKSAGIIDLFVGTGPFTAFIPSNGAFEKLGKSRLNELLKPQNRDKLISILTYHVVPGEYLTPYMRSEEVKTINGKMLHIRVEKGQVQVNNAKVIRPDLKGPNGVIHVIDTVLTP